MSGDTLTVADVLSTVDTAVVSALPGPVWVRGEVTGFRRTPAGAAFFRLADAEVDDVALEVGCRGRIMWEVDRMLDAAGVGALRAGIEVRVRGTVGFDRRRSLVRLSLLEVDPSFTAGRLAVDRDAVLRRLRADGALVANAAVEMPLVPLRVGLVTSRGSAAHRDFIHQLEASGYRFAVSTVHTNVQGEGSAAAVAGALRRLSREELDVVAMVRGGGSKLDLATFDTEEVARAVAAMPVPVVAGIGHEIDRSVADEAAAVSQKTPSAAGEWLVSAVRDFADRIRTARIAIRDESKAARARVAERLDRTAAEVAGVRTALLRRRDALTHLEEGIAHRARGVVDDSRRVLDGLEEWFSTVSLDDTIRRGFALVTFEDGRRIVRSVADVGPGDRLLVRVGDGTVPVVVEESVDEPPEESS